MPHQGSARVETRSGINVASVYCCVTKFREAIQDKISRKIYLNPFRVISRDWNKISYNFGFREKGKPNFVVTLPEITRCLEDWKEVGMAIISVHIIGHGWSLFGVKAESGLIKIILTKAA
jgi:hypothetical protein